MESFFALTQANYQKIQATVKQKWNKRKLLISNLQIRTLHHLLPLLAARRVQGIKFL